MRSINFEKKKVGKINAQFGKANKLLRFSGENGETKANNEGRIMFAGISGFEF